MTFQPVKVEFLMENYIKFRNKGLQISYHIIGMALKIFP